MIKYREWKKDVHMTIVELEKYIYVCIYNGVPKQILWCFKQNEMSSNYVNVTYIYDNAITIIRAIGVRKMIFL